MYTVYSHACRMSEFDIITQNVLLMLTACKNHTSLTVRVQLRFFSLDKVENFCMKKKVARSWEDE